MGLLAQLLSLPALALLAVLAGGSPTAAGLALGAIAGVGGGAGVVLLYRALAIGRASVVSPVTAVGATVIAALAGLAAGEALSATALLGVVLALAAVALVSAAPEPAAPGPPVAAPAMVGPTAPAPTARGRALPGPALPGPLALGPAVPRSQEALADEGGGMGMGCTTGLSRGGSHPHDRTPRPRDLLVPRTGWPARLRRPGLLEACGSALGFALFYVMLKRAGAEPSLWPLAATRLGSGAVLLAVALLTGALRRPDLPALRLLLLTAALDTAANSLYFLAARTSLLTLAAVLTSLYPASTVVLARLVLRERMTRTQLAGMGLALAGVALIAAG